MNRPKTWKILFVCLGNICRSPAAEGILKSHVETQGIQERVFIDSAGTASYHIGKSADPRMMAAAAKRGYVLTSKARALSSRDLREFDLIIAMDRDNFRAIHQIAEGAASHVHLLSEFLDDTWPTDVPDPYYGGEEGFEFVLTMLEKACPSILATVPGQTASS